jgi:hypothetical protein
MIICNHLILKMSKKGLLINFELSSFFPVSQMKLCFYKKNDFLCKKLFNYILNNPVILKLLNNFNLDSTILIF